MRNDNKFVTAKERHEAFFAFCRSHKSCTYCPLQSEGLKSLHVSCEYKWLDLEEGDEEPPQWQKNIMNKFTDRE